MVVRPLLLAPILLAALLAGCSEDPTDGTSTTTSSSASESETGTATFTASSTATSTTGSATTTTSASGTTTATSTTTTSTGPGTNGTGNETGNGTAPTGQTYSGEWVGGPYACALRRTAYAEADPQRNVLWDNVLIDPATIGRPFTAVFTATAPAAYIIMELTDEGGTALYSELILPGTGGTLSGEVPEDAHFAFFSSCGGAALTVEYSTA